MEPVEKFFIVDFLEFLRANHPLGLLAPLQALKMVRLLLRAARQVSLAYSLTLRSSLASHGLDFPTSASKHSLTYAPLFNRLSRFRKINGWPLAGSNA